jgi:LysR family transcriptional regulator for bpeEF and oprC
MMKDINLMDIRKQINPMLKLGDLAIFIAVVEQGSFTKAADYCQKPKSTISRHIRELEDSLGVRLLERNTRRLTLTDSGEQLLERARDLLDEVEGLEREVGRQGAPEGKIKLFVPIVLAALCADQIADFCEQHPGIHIDMNSTAAGQNLGIDTRFDLIVYIGQPPDSSFIARPLAEITFDYYTSPAYVEAHGLPESPDQIVDHAVVYRPIYDNESEIWHFGERSISIKSRIRVDSPYLSKALILQGVGLGRMPKLMVGNDVREGRLVNLFNGEYAYKEPLYAVYPSRRFVPATVKLLLDTLRETLPKRVEELESGELL